MIKMPNPAFNTLAVRTLSGAVLLVVVAGAMLLSPYTFIVLLLAMCAGCLHEFYNMAEKAGARPQRGLGVMAGGFGLASAFLLAAGFTGMWPGMVLTVAFVLFFAMFAAELYRKKENPVINISATLAGIIYTAAPLSMLCFVAFFPLAGGIGQGPVPGGIFGNAPAYKPMLPLCYIFLVWINDIAAYIFGVSFGRHRLFERISPKKSWEGFFGGLIVTAGCGVLFGHFMAGAGDAATNMLFWGGLAVVAVLSGVAGDLVESMFKRSVGIKDSGAIMPGHGGFLDRFDALLYSAPFVFLYFIIFAG